MRKDRFRILDANFNRAKEGLRVVEEVARFLHENPLWSRQLKTLRHQLSAAVPADLRKQWMTARDAAHDVGANALLKKRKNIDDIVLANLGRAEEALRVLEEFSDNGMVFQTLRFKVYDVEKVMMGVRPPKSPKVGDLSG